MKFKPIIKNPRVQATYDLDFKIKQKGQEFNLYDSIQEAREDTEIYPTLERYGCIPKELLDPNKVYADFRDMGDLMDMKRQQLKAQEMWDALPREVRKEFNNDKYLFVKEGEKYLQNKIAEMQAKETPITPDVVTPAPAPTTGTEVA